MPLFEYHVGRIVNYHLTGDSFELPYSRRASPSSTIGSPERARH
jgi:hypothetical protein